MRSARSRGGGTTYKPSEMAQGILDITSGGWTADGLAMNTEPSGEITLSTATQIKTRAFSHKSGITRVYAPHVTKIAQYAFSNALSGRIEATDFPNFHGGDGSFEEALITYANIPTWTTRAMYSFRNCKQLVELYLPNATGNIDRTAYGCTKLQIADIGKGNIANANSFYQCSALRTLILRNTSVQTLNAWSANCMGGIYSNPTSSTIYVPSALISSYQTATNWASAYNAGVTFTAIEGSQYEL